MALTGNSLALSYLCTSFFSLFQLSLYFSFAHSWHVDRSLFFHKWLTLSLFSSPSPFVSLNSCLPPVPLPPRKSVGLSASSLSPYHSDPVAQSQRPLSDQLPGRVQVLRRPLCLPETRQVPGGHCLFRRREGAGQGEDRKGGQEGDRNLQCDVHPHIRQMEWIFKHLINVNISHMLVAT